MRTELVEDALSAAFANRAPEEGVIFHSDRGCQYTSKDFADLARANGVVLSVGRKGECWDNAVAESFFATIKRELIDTRAWPTGAGLHRAVFEYIEGWYNTRRLHSSLGYRSPADYEALIHHNADRRRHDQRDQPVRRTGSSPDALIRVEVVGKRFHRITVEWTLNDWPSPCWIEAFKDAVRDLGELHLHVPSAYGQPMVMHDKTIVWAMFEADVQAAAALVDVAVVRANARFDVLAESPSDQGTSTEIA